MLEGVRVIKKTEAGEEDGDRQHFKWDGQSRLL